MDHHSVIVQLTDHLKHLQNILQYLDNSGNVLLIKAQCEKYNKSKNLVYTFKLLIDPAYICDIDAALGNLLLQDWGTVLHLFQQVVYKVIVELKLLPCQLTLSQISVILRFTSIPVLSKMVRDIGAVCLLNGMVIGLSAVSKYSLSTRYFCPDEYCEGHKGNYFIRVYIPGASEAQTVRKDFTCTFCFSTLREEKSSRSLSERVLAEVIPERFMSDIDSVINQRFRGQVIPVYIRDDLTKVVEIGQTYQIIGMAREDISLENITLTLEIHRPVSMKKLFQELPRNILKLYRDRESSPWSFVLTLAYIFGGDICPTGTYFTLKLGILLSLMSQLDSKVKPIHLLALGVDTELVSRLLQFGLRFKHIRTTLRSGQSLSGHVTRDKYNSAPYFVEGGLLHLSHNGICYVGGINRLKKSTIQQLQSAMSSGRIVTDIGTKFTGSLSQHMEQPLGSIVWGYSDPSATVKRQKQSEEELFITCSAGDIPKSLLDGDLTSSELKEQLIIEHTLSAAMVGEVDSCLPISSDDLKKFVSFASRLRPQFMNKAEALIHSYYLTCRKSRAMSDGNNVPVNADQTILSLAYSHAKLALRNEVTIYDALMAIKIYEESLTARFGFSTLGVQTMPHITSDLLDYCFGKTNDQRMEAFHSNLLRYCCQVQGLEE